MATSRFADLSEDEMEEILNETESRNTKNVIQVASKLFEDSINSKLNLRRADEGLRQQFSSHLQHRGSIVLTVP
jgi:hypothetical protein